jgi:hypothetical protein
MSALLAKPARASPNNMGGALFIDGHFLAGTSFMAAGIWADGGRVTVAI